MEVGADPNAVNVDGRTARYYAQRNGHVHIVAYLDRSTGWQPIHSAIGHRWPIARLIALLRGGADPRLRSLFGETPLQICTLADAAQGALPEDKPLTKVLHEAAAVAPGAARAVPAELHPARGDGAAAGTTDGADGGGVTL